MGKEKISLAEAYPALLGQWDYAKNDNLSPNDVTPGSGKKAYWLCNKGHEWEAPISDRVNGTGCPFCSNRKVWVGFNDLSSVCPNLKEEWNYDKNRDLCPEDIVFGSHKKVWWICRNGHEWQASVVSRYRGNGCPVCGKQKAGITNRSSRIKKGLMPLSETNPELLVEWDYEANTDFSPDEVSKGSGLTASWICAICGNKWNARIGHRANGVGCPKCSNELRTSFPEQAIFFYIKKLYNDVESRNDTLLGNGMELDIYIPSVKTAIEYDGARWHKSIKKDELKNKLCGEKHIRLIRIREKECPKLKNSENVITVIRSDNSSDESLKACIIEVGEILSVSINVDLFADRLLIYSQYINNVKENSFVISNPDLLNEWNYDRNDRLSPYYISRGSSKKVWWICSKGHEWLASVNHRTMRNDGCPVCSNQKLLVGYNDLQTVDPKLAKEWDYDKNKPLKPSDVFLNSNKKVWWKCENGHEWMISPNGRSKGQKCPFCSNVRVLPGFNDLATLNLELSSEWNYDKNGKHMPSEYTPGSGKKVWWKCSLGHEWIAQICSRNTGAGCPFCSNNRVLQGFNDLASMNPSIAKEWDYSKNRDVSPTNVTNSSNRKVWWICKNNHSYASTIANRCSGNGCPICSGRKVLEGFNDIATTRPDLLEEWDYEKNIIKPSSLTSGSGKNVWWKCKKCGYGWQSRISSRNRGTGCPKCGIQKSKKNKFKPVICLETQKRYRGLTDAMKETGISVHKISDCCKGRREMAGGFHWFFID